MLLKILRERNDRGLNTVITNETADLLARLAMVGVNHQKVKGERHGKAFVPTFAIYVTATSS